MGKDKQLDAMDKGKVKSKPSPVRVLLILFSCTPLFFSCSMPRIILLDDPLSPEEHLNLGVAYERKAEYDSAVKEYKKASRQITLAYVYIGNIFFQKGEFEEAEKAYRKAIDKDPLLADAYNNLAWLYYTRKEKLTEAESLATKALELNPNSEVYLDTLDRIKEVRKPNGV